MRISDWSSDVCSSDLRESPRYTQSLRNCSPRCCRRSRQLISSTKRLTCWTLAGKEFREGPAHLWFMMRFGSTTLRKPRKLTKFLPRFDESRSEERRVGKECVRRVDLGGRRIITKKQKEKDAERSDNKHKAKYN